MLFIFDLVGIAGDERATSADVVGAAGRTA